MDNQFTVPHKQQYNYEPDRTSEAAGISFEGTDVLVRAEYQDDADINNILARFGVDTMRPMQYGAEIDERVDLQSALMMVEEAKTLINAVPDKLKHKYATWQQLLIAADSGEYAHDLAEIKRIEEETSKRAVTPPEVTP